MFAVFVTTPRAGMAGAAVPYTVETAPLYATRAEAQAFADARVLSDEVKILFDNMPPALPPWEVSGHIYAAGDCCSDAGKSWRCVQPHTTAGDPNWAPSGTASLWSMLETPGATAWAYPVNYKLPAQCTYDGRLYDLIQQHRSQSDWAPPLVPALWDDVGSALDVPAYARALWWVVDTASADYSEVERGKEV